jgi:hypothetical protein
MSESINKVDTSISKVCAFTILLAIFIYQNPYEYLNILGLIIIIIINLVLSIQLL